MDELVALRDAIEQRDYTQALDLVSELEEMSREDKINKIDSYLIILLLHLIKQTAEQRTTRSWETSIWNAVRQINRTNKRRKAGGVYVPTALLAEMIAEAYPAALKRAALEAFEGRHDDEALGALVDRAHIEASALNLILTQQA